MPLVETGWRTTSRALALGLAWVMATASVVEAKPPAKPAAKAASAGKGSKAPAQKPAQKPAGAKAPAAKPAAKAPASKKAKGAANTTEPMSVGAPNKGRLQAGIALKDSRHLKRRPHTHGWGHPALVKLLRRASAKVARKHAGSVLLVGDLSSKAGGKLEGHNSHQSGRDADLGFYATNSKGVATPQQRFVAFDGAGKAKDGTYPLFDDTRNWALVEALLTDKEVTVRYLFVSAPLRARLLAYAAKKNVPKDLVLRAATVLQVPAGVGLHDDHFHLRITCPKASSGCIEESVGGEAQSFREPTKPAEAAKPAEPAKPAEAAKPAEPAKPAEAAKPAEPAKPAEAAKPAEPAKPAEAAKPAEPAKAAAPADAPPP